MKYIYFLSVYMFIYVVFSACTYVVVSGALILQLMTEAVVFCLSVVTILKKNSF